MFEFDACNADIGGIGANEVLEVRLSNLPNPESAATLGPMRVRTLMNYQGDQDGLED